MAGEKKYRGRRAYLNDFQLGEDGQYAYTGVRYRLCGERKKADVLWRLWLPAAALIVTTVGGACIPAAAMFGAFGALPLIGEVAAGGSAVWALAKLTPHIEKPKQYIYKQTVETLPRRAVVTAVFAGVGLAGCILHTVLFGFDGTFWATLALWITKAVQAVCALWLRTEFLKLKWRPRKPKAVTPPATEEVAEEN